MKGMRMAQGKVDQASKPPGGASTLFMSLRGGLGELTQALVQALRDGGVRLATGVGCQEIQPTTQGPASFQVVVENGEKIPADAVVLATPAFQTARLIRAFQPVTASLLDGIPYASTATISMAYSTEDLASQIRGFGFVVPRKEQHALLAATWSSLKWPERSRAEEILIRCYVGGWGREAILEQTDQSLMECVRQELQVIAGITAAPRYTEIHRWIRGMPQYVLGHQDRVRTIQRSLAEWPGIYVTGAGFYGIGIPDCIREGTKVGQQLMHDLFLETGMRDSANHLSEVRVGNRPVGG
jgi:protoporphyrinogen/coproporphyrinogen III oxidase